MGIRTGTTRRVLALALCGWPVAMQAEAPLSAIDWLSKSVIGKPSAAKSPSTGSVANQPAVKGEKSVSKVGALPSEVAVSVLDAQSLDGVGLLSPETTGFPHDLWGLGKTEEVITALAKVEIDGLPTLQNLMLTLLLAEAEPPADAGSDARLLTMRIDKLLEIGALDQAQALLDAAGPIQSADLFRRAFDVALLTGNEDRACETMRATPSLAPTLIARVFCLARSGDWNAAALTLSTAKAIGAISEQEDLLLSRFLDPELFDGEDVPEPPTPVTPLIWRIYEAVGEPLGTATLPAAFSQADLSDRAGWKSQLEAVERLARVGAVSPNALLGLYTDRTPAASGGVWDRVDAFQRLDAAISQGDATLVEQRLPLAWARMGDVELEVPFATLFASALAKFKLTGDAAGIAYQMGLLSPDYERLAKSNHTPQDNRSRFLAGLAAGSVKGLIPPDSMARAIAPAFTTPVLPEDFVVLSEQKRVGEEILLAMTNIEDGLQGNMSEVAQGLSVLRLVGLETVARRTALELMLLERRG